MGLDELLAEVGMLSYGGGETTTEVGVSSQIFRQASILFCTLILCHT